MNVEIGAEAALFPEKEYTNGIAVAVCSRICTAKTKYRNFETNISRKEYRGLNPNFHIHASVSDLYIPTIGLPILLEEYVQ